jgi:hypothetical protein
VRYGGATRTNLLGDALAAASGAVVASFFGVFGTLAGAGVMSIFMAVATAGYAHSLASAHGWMRPTLLRRADGEAEAGEPPTQPIRWQRVALAAAVVFAIAIGRSPPWRRPQAAACQPGRQPATTRGEHVGRRSRGSVDCTGTPGSGHPHHVAVGVCAHHHGAGRCCHDDRAGGGRPEHHGSQRHGPDHDHLEYAGPTTQRR